MDRDLRRVADLARTACAAERDRWARSALTGLVIDLGRDRAGTVRDKLARALGDSSLQIAYLLDGERAAVDETGRPVAVPPPGSGRAVTPVAQDGRTLALLIHDRFTLREPGLVDGVAAALAVAVTNVRLRAEIRARMRDVEASTARLLDAAAAQRRRLAGELRAQVQPALERAGGALAEAGRGDDLLARLGRVRGQLTALADGLDPAGLETGGLAGALHALAAGAGLPVRTDVPPERFPRDVERCAWFVCSEALANIVRHAKASRATIDVRAEAGALWITVADDGVGGAEPMSGSGLRRLGERVHAAGGRMRVESVDGSGTRVVATLELGVRV